MTKRNFDRAYWLSEASRRTGIPEDLLEKTFAGELDADRGVFEPLEVPDVMRIRYKYSYGGQSRFFREIRDNARIMGAKCSVCGMVYCPPRADCSECYAPTEWVPVSSEGAVVTCTKVYFSTSQFLSSVPYNCAYVKLDGADTWMFHNIDAEDVKPGDRVKAVFREKRCGLMSDFVFKPVGE
ncbi:MAG: Zn-ribbon domain-containing OB-fold protein [bacterium]